MVKSLDKKVQGQSAITRTKKRRSKKNDQKTLHLNKEKKKEHGARI